MTCWEWSSLPYFLSPVGWFISSQLSSEDTVAVSCMLTIKAAFFAYLIPNPSVFFFGCMYYSCCNKFDLQETCKTTQGGQTKRIPLLWRCAVAYISYITITKFGLQKDRGTTDSSKALLHVSSDLWIPTHVLQELLLGTRRCGKGRMSYAVYE